MSCQRNHVDAMLTLGQRLGFKWLQFIASCYNFIQKINFLKKVRTLKLLTFCAAFSLKRLTL